MTAVNILDAKSNLSRLIARVETGADAEIVIARNGRPVARLVPLKTASAGKRLGIAKGQFTVPDNIDADEDAVAALFHAPPSEPA